MLNSWVGIIVVLSALLGLMALLRRYRVKANPHPEILRKLLHVGMGLVTLTFPWVFAQVWPVWVLAAVSALLLAATRLPSPLQPRLGGVVDGVARDSLGDLYFPLSVALVFQFSERQPVLYCIPVLLLTLADAVAALIGIFYGHAHFPALGGRKSVEGSLAFFTVAFLSTHVPLLLFTNVGRAESLLLGATIGLLVMLIEAIAWNGLDNLLVPLGGFLLLTGYLPIETGRLSVLLAATVLWVTAVFLLRRRSTLNDGALLGAALVGYLTWSLGGWQWTLPPLTFYLAYTLIWPNRDYLRQRPHDIRAVVAICTPGLLLLTAARQFDRWELFFPYVVVYAAQLAFIGVGYLHERQCRMASPGEIGLATVKGWLPLMAPLWLLQGAGSAVIVDSLAALAIVIVVATLFNRIFPRPDAETPERIPWLPQGAFGTVAALLALILLYWPWRGW